MLTLTGVMLHVIFFVFCLFGTQGKPSLTFDLPGPLGSLINTDKNVNKNSIKVYSGKRVRNDTIRMVYYFDQTVAILELGPNKLLLNCELIEIFEPDQVTKAMGELQHTTTPLHLTFNEMLELMDDCAKLDKVVEIQLSDEHLKNYTKDFANRGLLSKFSNGFLTIFNYGITPGTKWCGPGDIAEDYFDLGMDENADRCCRAHDLCPIKIHGFSRRYNLTNRSVYTKTHCECDDRLFDCFKQHLNTSPAAGYLGTIFFTLIRIPCIEETPDGKKFRSPKSNFWPK